MTAKPTMTSTGPAVAVQMPSRAVTPGRGRILPTCGGLRPSWETRYRTFVINELAVRGPFRRSGVGTRLHAGLLHGLTSERVTLTVRPEPEADPARRAYGRPADTTKSARYSPGKTPPSKTHSRIFR